MCNNNTTQITDINTLQFIHKLHNFIQMSTRDATKTSINVAADSASSVGRTRRSWCSQ